MQCPIMILLFTETKNHSIWAQESATFQRRSLTFQGASPTYHWILEMSRAHFRSKNVTACFHRDTKCMNLIIWQKAPGLANRVAEIRIIIRGMWPIITAFFTTRFIRLQYIVTNSRRRSIALTQAGQSTHHGLQDPKESIICIIMTTLGRLIDEVAQPIIWKWANLKLSRK